MKKKWCETCQKLATEVDISNYHQQHVISPNPETFLEEAEEFNKLQKTPEDEAR